MAKATDPLGENSEVTGEEAEDGNIRYLCMKYNRHQQGKQITCQDPDLYCKYRSSCLIHYQEKQRRRRQANASASEA